MTMSRIYFTGSKIEHYIPAVSIASNLHRQYNPLSRLRTIGTTMIKQLNSSRALTFQYLLLFLSFSIGVIATALSPASGYELSIYAETPLVFWIGTLPLLVHGSIVGLLRQDRFKWLGIAGAFLVVSTVVLLPFVRGYFFYGPSDSMLHLGTLKSVVDGHQDPSGLFYPALFLLATSVTFLADVPPRVALMTAVFVFPFIWFLSIPAIVRELVDDRAAIGIGIVCALYLAPLNSLNLVLVPHPSSQALFFAPVVLFTFFRLTKTASARDIGCFAVTFLALYFYHPQQSLNLLFVCLALAFVGRTRFHSRFSERNFHRISTPILFAGGITVVMLLISTDRFAEVFGFVVRSLITETGAGGVEGRTSALTALDVSIPLLALKIGLKNVVLGIGSLIALGGWWRYRRTDQVPLLIVATLPILGFVVLFGAVGMLNQLVRYIAVIALVATIVGAIGFTRHVNPASRYSLQSIAIALLLCIGLLAAVPVIHSDPYTERPGPHVPESHFSAFETQFDHAAPDGQFLRIRAAPYRYYTAIHGTDTEPEFALDRPLPAVPDGFEGLDEEYDGRYYLPVTERDERADTELYDGFRYDEDDFDGLNHDPDKARIYDNGGVVFYTNLDTDTENR